MPAQLPIQSLPREARQSCSWHTDRTDRAVRFIQPSACSSAAALSGFRHTNTLSGYASDFIANSGKCCASTPAPQSSAACASDLLSARSGLTRHAAGASSSSSQIQPARCSICISVGSPSRCPGVANTKRPPGCTVRSSTEATLRAYERRYTRSAPITTANVRGSPAAHPASNGQVLSSSQSTAATSSARGAQQAAFAATFCRRLETVSSLKSVSHTCDGEARAAAHRPATPHPAPNSKTDCAANRPALASMKRARMTEEPHTVQPVTSCCSRNA